MFDILITGSALYTGSELVRDAFVYIKNGKIEDYGESPVPEDYTYATLILGGEGRIIVPGLTMVLDAPAYPVRIYKPSLEWRSRFYSMITPSEALTLSLPAIYEAHFAGATTILVEFTSIELPISLESKIGGYYGLAYPACREEPPRHESIPVLTLYGENCGAKGDIEVRGSQGYVDGEEALALFHRPSYTRLEGDPLTMSRRVRKALGLEGPSIEKGVRAEIAVYNASRPPGAFLDKAGEEVIRRIYSSGAKIESLIAGQTILIDQGEHLYIVEKQFSEARRAGMRLLKRR